MSQYADPEDLTLGTTYHVLLRETEALEKTVAEMLNIERHSTTGTGTDFAGVSFHREFEVRYRTGRLTVSSAFSALRLLLKEIDRYRTTLANLVGFVSREQQLRPQFASIDLVALLEEAVDAFEAPALTKGILIRCDLPPSAAIRADPQLLHRLFVNLLDNAIKYSYRTTAHTAQRHVDVQCKRHSTDGHHLVSVTSYGVGIEQEEIDSGMLFEYGVRGKWARDREREGTGIGLAEAKRIVDAHNGFIKLKSEARSGAHVTTVTVVLPARPI